ncbi:peptide-methionine (S)-S-oxide reductase MsrA [Algoriella sp.]|uniref:peptide-methionine (S)-S-oxide reductase MsrA n=1 Tax=Algoriella sp. TaxID=1872434 RepID=UPI002FCA4ED0
MAVEVAILGAGCFWCVEGIYNSINGVESAISGFTGGDTENPTYKDICETETNHAEVVEVTFDPSIISYKELLEIFWNIHNPTQLNRQGNDIGTQYRSSIFYISDEQKKQAEESLKEFDNGTLYEDKFVTTIEPLEKFWSAEDYHQGYYNENPDQPYCSAVVGPKIAKFKSKFKQILK